jgi:hypothetical protein
MKHSTVLSSAAQLDPTNHFTRVFEQTKDNPDMDHLFMTLRISACDACKAQNKTIDDCAHLGYWNSQVVDPHEATAQQSLIFDPKAIEAVRAKPTVASQQLSTKSTVYTYVNPALGGSNAPLTLVSIVCNGDKRILVGCHSDHAANEADETRQLMDYLRGLATDPFLHDCLHVFYTPDVFGAPIAARVTRLTSAVLPRVMTVTTRRTAETTRQSRDALALSVNGGHFALYHNVRGVTSAAAQTAVSQLLDQMESTRARVLGVGVLTGHPPHKRGDLLATFQSVHFFAGRTDDTHSITGSNGASKGP